MSKSSALRENERKPDEPGFLARAHAGEWFARYALQGGVWKRTDLLVFFPAGHTSNGGELVLASRDARKLPMELSCEEAVVLETSGDVRWV